MGIGADSAGVFDGESAGSRLSVSMRTLSAEDEGRGRHSSDSASGAAEIRRIASRAAAVASNALRPGERAHAPVCTALSMPQPAVS